MLRRGALKLGILSSAIARDVKGCWNFRSCGLGRPTNAEQSMLVTTILAALDGGAQLLVETRAEPFEIAKGRVKSLICRNIQLTSAQAKVLSAHKAIKIVAKHYVLSEGSITSPSVLLRSEAPDPQGNLGWRTFLHPVVVSSAVFNQKVEAWSVAPQTIYTDHFLQTHSIDGPIGCKLDAHSLDPIIFASTVPGICQAQYDLLKTFPNSHTLPALFPVARRVS